jgi:hypothetical protein
VGEAVAAARPATLNSLRHRNRPGRTAPESRLQPMHVEPYLFVMRRFLIAKLYIFIKCKKMYFHAKKSPASNELAGL